MKKWTSVCMCLFFCLCIHQSHAQKRADLEAQRQEIIKELEIAEKQVKLAEKNTEATVSELAAINANIAGRKKLIKNLDNQLQLAEMSLTANRDSIALLSARLSTVESEYADIMRLAYRKRMASSPWISIFTSKSVNEALLIWRYTQQFQAFVTHKRNEVAEMQALIDEKNEAIEDEKRYTVSLLADEKQNYSSLEQSQKEKDKILRKMKGREQELKAERDQKKKQREKLNQRIEEIILAELKARKKSNPTASTPNPSFSVNHSLPWPTDGYISSKFGKQAHPTIDGVQITNNGIDIHSNPGANVTAISAGTVVGVTKIPGYDHMVIIEHGSHYTVYSRIAECKVSKGQNVVAGTVLGRLDDRGELHFEIWKEKTKLDPAKWLKKK